MFLCRNQAVAELSERHTLVNYFLALEQKSRMETRIVVNAEPLSASFVPDTPLRREKELNLISSHAKNGVNTFIYGAPGSGKTTILRKTCIDSSSQARRVVYIDCSLYQTVNSVLREILTDRLVFSRSNYDLLKKLQEKTRLNKATICLDHFERITEPETVTKLLGIGLSVIMAGNNEDNLEELDLRTRSFISSVIPISSYSEDDALSILKARSEQALAKYTFKESTLKKITEKTSGNIALALTTLRACAVLAESQGKRTIEDINVDEILRQHDCPVKLSTDEKVLVKILEEWKSLPSNRLFHFYSTAAKYPKQERSFRKYMAKLREKGLVKAVGDRTGRYYEIVAGERSVGS